MATILMIGIDPAEVDFSNPALPPGLDADKVRAGIELGLHQLRSQGHTVSQMHVPADPTKLQPFADRLTTDPVDCVTIGGGVTRPPENTELLEALLNIITRTNPSPRVALVARPDQVLAAVNRVMR